MKRRNNQPDRTLLIYHAGALGDTLLLYPILRAFLDAQPEVKVVAVGEAPWRLLFNLGWVEKFFSCHNGWVSEWFSKNPPTTQHPLDGWLNPPVKAWVFLKHPPEGLLRWLSHVCTDPPACLPIRPPRHIGATTFYARTLMGINIPKPYLLAPRVVIDEKPKPALWPKRRVLIHPGAGSQAKSLPLPWVSKLYEALLGLHIQPFFLIGPAERESGASKPLEHLGPIVAPDTLESLYRTLCEYVAFVGTDSGPSHMASLLGLYTLTFFGPSDARAFAPSGPFGAVFSSGHECAPCMPENALQACMGERPCLAVYDHDLVAKVIHAFFERGWQCV
jgi:ADP-heptose:LPS heptosyltransferase